MQRDVKHQNMSFAKVERRGVQYGGGFYKACYKTRSWGWSWSFHSELHLYRTFFTAPLLCVSCVLKFLPSDCCAVQYKTNKISNAGICTPTDRVKEI